MTNNDQLSQLIFFVTSEGRICPQPALWAKLTEILKVTPSSKRPPKPLILNGWYAPDWEKRERLIQQLGFAANNGMLDAAEKYLREIDLDDWHRSDCAN